jgi:hypothetical protein
VGEDEAFILIASLSFGGIGGAVWWWRLLAVASMHDHPWMRRLLALSLPAVTGLIWLGLRTWAASDVRDAPEYLLQYTAMGAAVLVSVQWILAPLLSLSGRLDVAERENAAVLWALLGAQLGFGLAWLGANFGEGPGWWCVALTGALSCGSLAVLWALLLGFGGLAERLTIERDAAAGLRLGGWLVGMGLVAGRGASGDWHGGKAALRDFLWVAGPTLALSVVGFLVLERALRPAPDQPAGDPWLAGVVPAVVWVVVGLTQVGQAGPW